MTQRCTRWERWSPGGGKKAKSAEPEICIGFICRDNSSFRLNKYVKNTSYKCFLRGLADASSLPHTASNFKLWYEIPSIIIHTVNDSDEDDTIDDDDIMIPLQYHYDTITTLWNHYVYDTIDDDDKMTFSSYISILSKNGRDYENGRIKCICHEIGPSSGESRNALLKRVCGITIRFTGTSIILPDRVYSNIFSLGSWSRKISVDGGNETSSVIIIHQCHRSHWESYPCHQHTMMVSPSPY